MSDHRRMAEMLREAADDYSGCCSSTEFSDVCRDAAKLCEREALVQELLRQVDGLPASFGSLHWYAARVREYGE